MGKRSEERAELSRAFRSRANKFAHATPQILSWTRRRGLRRRGLGRFAPKKSPAESLTAFGGALGDFDHLPASERT